MPPNASLPVGSGNQSYSNRVFRAILHACCQHRRGRHALTAPIAHTFDQWIVRSLGPKSAWMRRSGCGCGGLEHAAVADIIP